MDYPDTEVRELGEKLKKLCQSLNFTLSTAESCTGGLVASAMTDFPGSSEVYLGGVCAYANQIKVSMLGVEPGLLRQYGAVSGQVAEAMASGVLEKTGAQLGLSTTGIAGPGGATEGKPVGTVWCGAALRLGQEVRVESKLFQLKGTRHEIRSQAVRCALAWLIERLEDLTSPAAFT